MTANRTQNAALDQRLILELRIDASGEVTRKPTRLGWRLESDDFDDEPRSFEPRAGWLRGDGLRVMCRLGEKRSEQSQRKSLAGSRMPDGHLCLERAAQDIQTQAFLG